MPASSVVPTLAKPGSAKEIAKQAELEEEVLQRLQPDNSVLEFVEQLLQDEEQEHAGSAMKLLSFALERREAVWWSIQCVKGVPQLIEKPPSQSALSAAEEWFKGFSDASRRAAFAKSEELDLAEPAALPGVAAFFCEGSMGPADLPESIPAEENQVFEIAAATASMAAVFHEPQHARDRYNLFVQLAKDIADKKNRWKETAGAAGPGTAPVPLPTVSTAESSAAPGSPAKVDQFPAGPRAPERPLPPRPPKKGYY